MNLTKKIQRAMDKAAVLHLGQVRKAGNLPYIIHPFSVACIASKYTNDEDIICACLLHDVLEDVDRNKYDKENMTADFGERVANLVSEVSEDKDASFSLEKEKATWKARKEAYIEAIGVHSEDSLIVSAADKIHNLKSLIDSYKKEGDVIWEKFNAPEPKKSNTLWFYEEILKVLEKRLDNEIVEEYSEVIKEAKSVFNL